MLAETIIAPEYQKKYVTFLDFSTLEERLEHNENLTEVFKDLNGVWFSAFLVPISYDEEGRIVDVLFACRNINDYMQKEEAYQEQLKKIARDAKIANAAKTSFLRRMSHDVRTPVNGIRGMAVLAEKSLGSPEKTEEYIQKIITSSDYLQELLDDILRMNKLESGTMEFEQKPFDLKKVLSDTAEFIEARAKEKKLFFTVDMKEITHTHVIGSPLHLRQVVQNILSNAVKFNNPGGSIAVKCREISCKDEVVTIEIVCVDTGTGISPEFQPHVFEPFTQETDSARSKYSGNGLGLAVTKEIVEQRGGTITFTSKVGKGTTFIVTIPFQMDLAAADVSKDLSAEGSIEGIKILLVEDNELNMEIAHCLLEESGAIITEAYNGRDAVEIFASSDPGTFDIILMDIMMPEMDGMEAARTIRKMKREDALTIPIFAMTANAFIDDISQSRAAGMNEHLTKPLDMEDVVGLIYQYCR